MEFQEQSDLLRLKQISPETGLTNDAINIVHPFFYVESETIIEELKDVDPLPHYEDVYPPEKFPSLYDASTNPKIQEFDAEIDNLNNLVEKAKRGEVENSQATLISFEDSLNHILTMVRGKNAKQSEFIDISGRHLHRKPFNEDEDELLAA